jgi:YidC/Oxa1 family membrane protein insertase
MDIKNFILPLFLALLTMWAIQYWFFTPPAQRGDSVQSGQTFIAPQSKMEAQPLIKEVDFIDQDEQPHNDIETVVETDGATYLFSSHGACLEQLTFKRIMNGKTVAVPTFDATQRELKECSFLVALDKKTPVHYQLIENKAIAGAQQLTYRAQTELADIEKIFTIYQARYQVDLKIRITPRHDMVQARVLFGAPVLREARPVNDQSNALKEDAISGIANNQKGSIEKVALANIDLHKGWFLPTFFGSEDRYFVHALVADPQSFTQRAYYDMYGHQGLIAILESALFNTVKEWNLSFYLGPKEDQAMNAVDPRLEQTLEHSGMLAPLSRFLLVVLKYLYGFVHNYGWAIIIMTILINLILLPLNLKSAQSMKKNAELQKKLTYLQHRYKDDPDTLNRERNELLSKNGMAMVGGCLPKLLQLPIFFALSRVLSSSIELYRAPFIGWIQDLSAPDPYYMLPTLIGLGLIFQPNAMTDPKQRFTMIAMALLFWGFTLKFAAGLCLYILVGLILNIIQMFVQQKFNWA